MERVRIFISYSKNDYDLMKGVEHVFNYIQKINYFGVNYEIDIMNDQYITAGESWKDKIEEYINEADVIVFLLSENFINSKFIQKYEVPRSIERQTEDGIKIMGVYLSECDYKKSYIKKTQLVPQFKGRLFPIESWDNKDQYWETIVDALTECAYISINNLPWNLRAPKNNPLPPEMKEKKMLRNAPFELSPLYHMAYNSIVKEKKEIIEIINDDKRRETESLIKGVSIAVFFLMLLAMFYKVFILN